MFELIINELMNISAYYIKEPVFFRVISTSIDMGERGPNNSHHPDCKVSMFNSRDNYYAYRVYLSFPTV